MSTTGLLEAPQTTDPEGLAESEPAPPPPQRIKLTEIVLSLIAGMLFAWYLLGPVEGQAATEPEILHGAIETTPHHRTETASDIAAE